MTRTRARQALRRLPDRAARLLRSHPQAADVLLVVVLWAIVTTTSLALVVPELTAPPDDVAIALRAAVLVGPLALRRRFPVAVLMATVGQLPFYWGFGQNNEIGAWTVLGIAVYSAAAYGRRPLAAWVSAGLLAALAGLVAVSEAGRQATAQIAAAMLFLLVPFLLAWTMGTTVGQLRRTRRELQERNEQLATEREASARRAVLEERVRIARELHDVVAHYVSLMSVQAAAARRLFRSKPEQALEAIGEVEAAGRQAVHDMQQLLLVLRSDETAPTLDPQPDLRRLPDLVEHTRRAGLSVDLHVEGELRPLPAAVELSLYRIAQEALTNTLKHAAASHADVRLRYQADAVELDVTDDGRAGAEPRDGGTVAGGRKGLVGMRERIGLIGGRLEAGPLPEGGFRVHAVVAT
jgi:signal transduction histidine kinase